MTRIAVERAAMWLGMLCGLAAPMGCDRVDISPAAPANAAAKAPPAAADVPGAATTNLQNQVDVTSPADPSSADRLWTSGPWIPEERLPWHAWDIQYLGGKRIGYSHLEVSRGENLVRIKRTTVFELLRGGEAVQYKIDLEALEYPDGRLASFTERTSTGANTNTLEGQLLNNKLTLITNNASGSAQSSIPWEDGTWGVLEIQAMLLSGPMQPGEKKTGRILVPKLRKIIPVELVAGAPEVTSLPGGITEELLPVEVTMTSGETSLRSRNWIDDKGEILKAVALDGTLASTFRAPPEVATRIADEYRLKTLLGQSVVFQGNPPPNSKTAAYAVDGSNMDLYAAWSKNVRQSVKSVSALRSEVTVLDVSDAKAMSQIEPLPPEEEDLEASTQIPAQHPAIQDLAVELASGATQPRPLALALTQGVQRKLKKTDFEAGIATALETARRREGDCTEHAMLLVALLRNRGIPARVASGLKIDEGVSRLVFHMWTEAWVDDRWLPLDAMTGGIAGVDCLKMSDSSLAGENPYPEVFAVFDKMPHFQVELLRSE